MRRVRPASRRPIPDRTRWWALLQLGVRASCPSKVGDGDGRAHYRAGVSAAAPASPSTRAPTASHRRGADG